MPVALVHPRGGMGMPTACVPSLALAFRRGIPQVAPLDVSAPVSRLSLRPSTEPSYVHAFTCHAATRLDRLRQPSLRCLGLVCPLWLGKEVTLLVITWPTLFCKACDTGKAQLAPRCFLPSHSHIPEPCLAWVERLREVIAGKATPVSS